MLLETLQIFCDIIETESFSKAAARNYISQPAVSQQVKALEDKFNQKLIERSPHGIAPTDAGRVFYQGAREMLARYQELERQMLELTQTVAGTIRVATVYSVGLHHLPPYVKRFIKQYPQAHIHVEYSRTNKIYDAIKQNLVDIGIVAYPHEDRAVGVMPWTTDEMVLIVSPEHPWAERSEPVLLKDLHGQPFVAFETDIPTRQAIDQELRRLGINVKIVQEFDNVETVKRSVEADLGFSIIPRRTAQLEVKAGSLVALPVADLHQQRPVGVIYKKGKSFSTTLEKFLEVLTAKE